MTETKPLSDRARVVWAKTRKDPAPPYELSGWLPLHQHLADTAAIAGHLWDEWCPTVIKQGLTTAVGSEAAARGLVVWLAGVHDVGKASPAFAVQVPALAEDMRMAGLPIDPRIGEGVERRGTRHELVSFLATRRWLEETHGFASDKASAIASVTAAHHGQPASDIDANAAAAQPRLVGDGAWDDVRQELLKHADVTHASPKMIASWGRARLSQPDLVLLSGLVIVADWLASSDEFDAAPLGEQPIESAATRASRAWANLDFPRPWRSKPPTTDPAELLRRRFALPSDAEPRPAQAAFLAEALRVERPELMILEAEMGSGKTEAALLTAEILAARFGMGGIFVGLPTQATADAMFSRVLRWAELLDLDIPSTVFLARGKSELNPDFAERTREAFFRSIDTDGRRAGSDSLVVAHRWFTQPRRGPLSNFVVGTVDQALFAGLRSRYVMLRHLALASKVVVIDEAHAYDDYMEEFLTRVLEWLGAYGAPVVMLSATLPSRRRRDFLDAYNRGRDALRPRVPTEEMTPQERRALAENMRHGDRERYQNVEGRIGYPVISVSDSVGAPRVVTPAASGSARQIRLEQQLEDDLPKLQEILTAALRDGGNVAVVRNTVRRAQETAAFLRTAFPDVPVTLAHSRFLVLDRARKDRELLERYGPGGERPPVSIVVATQVIEQSLDVDFDVMVTDIAPIDLILQRVGRLHRHPWRDRPEPVRRPRLIMTGVDRSSVPPAPEPGSVYVYGRAILLRTLAVLEGRTSITIPDDIAPLVETVYGTDDAFIPDSWRTAVADAERQQERRRAERRRRAQSFTLGNVANESVNLLGWVTGPELDPELTPPGRRATVRDGDETLEVIVVQRGADGVVRTPDWLGANGGIQLPDNEPPSNALSRTLLGCTLRLPAGMCHGNAIDRHIDELERRFEFPTWHASHALKGELALVLDETGDAVLNEFDLHYSPDSGLGYVDRSRPVDTAALRSLGSR